MHESGVGVGILRTIKGNWSNVFASHCEVESDGGNQLVLMTMGGVLLIPRETTLQIWGYVDASVLSF